MIPKQKSIFLFLGLLNFLYFICSSYMTTTNDGSHFALVSSIVEKGSVKINDYVIYTHFVDYALKDGDYYSDRLPGTALLTIPFYLLGKIAHDTGLATLIHSDYNIREVFVIFLPNIAGTLSVYLLYRLFLSFGFSFKESLFTSVIFALSTITWLESTHLYSHILCMAVVLWAALLVIEMDKFEQKNMKVILAISVLLGLSALLEVQNLLFAAVFVGYLFMSGKLKGNGFFEKKHLSPFIAGITIFFAIFSILFIYNYIAFNEITIKSNKYNPNFTYEKSLLSSLSGSLVYGVDRLFTNFNNPEVIFNWSKGIRNDSPGLLILSPILLLSLAGFYRFFKERKSEALFFLLLIISEVVVVGSHKTVWTRYAAPIVPYLFFPLIYIVRYAFDLLNQKSTLGIKSYIPLLSILALSLYSAIRGFYVMNNFYGRSTEYPFRFLDELPSYFIFYGTISLIFLIICLVKNFFQKADEPPFVKNE